MKDVDPLITVAAVGLASIFAWFVGLSIGIGLGLVFQGLM